MPKNHRHKVHNVSLIIRLPKGLRDGLRRVAKKQNTTVSALIRGALLREVASGGK